MLITTLFLNALRRVFSDEIDQLPAMKEIMLQSREYVQIKIKMKLLHQLKDGAQVERRVFVHEYVNTDKFHRPQVVK